jgi:hypothetical protein
MAFFSIIAIFFIFMAVGAIAACKLYVGLLEKNGSM